MITLEEIEPLVYSNRWFTGRMFRVKEHHPYGMARVMQVENPRRWHFEGAPAFNETRDLRDIRTYPLANTFGVIVQAGIAQIRAYGRTPCHFALLDGARDED